jgi:hypothetical protein
MMPSRKTETETVLATAQPYLDMSARDLERLLDEALDHVESGGGLPHRRFDDRSFWRGAVGRLKRELAKQDALATATTTTVATQAVIWAHDVGLDLADYNIPIAVVVALTVKSIWDQMSSADDGGADGS